MDWGFMVFGDDLEGAAAAYDAAIRTHLMGQPPAPAPEAAAAAAAAGPGAAAAGLAGALRRLLNRAHSDAGEAAAAAVAAAAGSGPPGSASEPSSPMLGVLQAARANFSGGGSVSGGGMLAPGAAAGGGAAAAGAAGGGLGVKAAPGPAAAGEVVPDAIRAAPGSHLGRREGDHRIPSFQTGLKPW
jgi:hypothetical protein